MWPHATGHMTQSTANARRACGHSSEAVLEILLADPQGAPVPNQPVSIVSERSGTEFREIADASARIRKALPLVGIW